MQYRLENAAAGATAYTINENLCNYSYKKEEKKTYKPLQNKNCNDFSVRILAEPD